VSAHLGFRSAGPDEVAARFSAKRQPFFVYVVEGELNSPSRSEKEHRSATTLRVNSMLPARRTQLLIIGPQSGRRVKTSNYAHFLRAVLTFAGRGSLGKWSGMVSTWSQLRRRRATRLTIHGRLLVGDEVHRSPRRHNVSECRAPSFELSATTTTRRERRERRDLSALHFLMGGTPVDESEPVGADEGNVEVIAGQHELG